MSACLRRSLAEWLTSGCGISNIRHGQDLPTSICRSVSALVRVDDTISTGASCYAAVGQEVEKVQQLQLAFARSGVNAAVSWNLAASCTSYRRNKFIHVKTAARKLGQLQQHLPVDTLQEILRKNAFILGFKMDGVGQRLKALCSVLNINQQHLHALLVKTPLLLFIDPATVPERVEKFGRLFGASPEQSLRCFMHNPGFLTFPDDYWEARSEQLCEILGMNRHQMTTLVRRYGPLLLSKPLTVSKKVDHVQQILGLPRDTVLRIVAQQPPILGLNTHILQDRLQQLTRIFGADHSQIVEMIAKQPVVLCYSESLLCHRWSLLHHLSSSHPNWQESFEKLSLASKSRFLRCSQQRLDRLKYLKDAKRQGELKMSVILNMTDKKFQQKFPEYAYAGEGS